ncbi:hypothetical protein Bca52824_079594 [Brassica carinata]|uniref:TF-B3 domain-containing protein n=1 Tax=Brassica carinata TaxID=52824 RepID=A0A8X7PYV1_BRACI|nr:hypothetical protein Bca52824_079594 [Brassica carinata]
MRRSFPMHPSCLTTAIVEYVSQEDASPPLRRKKRPMDPSLSAALAAYFASQEDASPPLSRKKPPRASSSSTALVEYASQEDASPPPLRGKKRPPPFPPKAKQPQKKAKVAAPSSWASEPAPDWLLKLVEGEEDEPKRIIEKELSATDVNHNHNRLSMPCSKIIDLEFLSIAEQGLIEVDEGKKHKTGINSRLVVKFVDSGVLKEFGVNFRRWKMPKKEGDPTFIYNLVTGWNDVVDGCGLGAYDRIRVWSFHSDGELRFALALDTPAPLGHPLLLPPPSDSEDANPEEMSSALVIYDKSNDDLRST